MLCDNSLISDWDRIQTLEINDDYNIILDFDILYAMLGTVPWGAKKRVIIIEIPEQEKIDVINKLDAQIRNLELEHCKIVIALKQKALCDMRN